jgi:hypothetical protein
VRDGGLCFDAASFNHPVDVGKRRVEALADPGDIQSATICFLAQYPRGHLAIREADSGCDFEQKILVRISLIHCRTHDALC